MRIIMYKNYQIAEIPAACVSEINKLQDHIKNQTEEEIVLVAYKPEKPANNSKE